MKWAIEEPHELDRMILRLEKNKNPDDLLSLLMYIAEYWEDIKSDDSTQPALVEFTDAAIGVVDKHQSIAEDIEDEVIPTRMLTETLESISTELEEFKERALNW